MHESELIDRAIEETHTKIDKINEDLICERNRLEMLLGMKRYWRESEYKPKEG